MSGEVRDPVAVEPALRRSGASLAAATFASGILGYVYIVVLTRSLGPQLYGELGALLGLTVIFAVTSTALQLEATRAVALDPAGPTGWILRRGALVSVGTMVLGLLIAPLVVRTLHLSSAWPAIGVAAVLLPQTFIGGQLGILLGGGRHVAFSLLLVLSAGSRTVAAVATAVLGGGPNLALWITAATALAVNGIGALQLRRGDAGGVSRERGVSTRHTAEEVMLAGNETIVEVGLVESAESGTTRPGWGGLVRASIGAGALLALLNADLLAARSVLGGTESGWYAFLTLFGRVTFWGTNFLALWVFPHVASRGSASRAVRVALAAVAAVGTLAIVVTWAFDDALTRALAGPAYAAAAPSAPAFAAVGMLLAVVQLATYVDVARARHTVSVIVWLGAFAVATAVRFVAPVTVRGIVTTALVVLAVVAGLSLATLVPRKAT